MSTRSYAYYPGCSLHASAAEYDVSTRLVHQRLGIELREVPDWTCCGASSAHRASRLLGYALPAHNLRLAEEMGLPLATPCPACFSRLKFASHDLHDPKRRAAVSEALGGEFRNTVEVLPILATLSPEEVAGAVQKPLRGLKVACYYGCVFVRPGKVTNFDDEENPQSMDRLLQAAGAETIDWAFKTECCGASLSVPRPEVVHRLAGRILAAAKRHGADCVAVACPLCQANLDQRQGAISAQLGERVDMPVIYYTQLLGIALGYSPREMMMERLFVDPVPLLRAKALASSAGER